MSYIQVLTNYLRRRNQQDSQLHNSIQRILGTVPGNLSLYRMAFRHASMNGEQPSASVPTGGDHNERLEYLGDAILGAIIADYLFRRYPFKNEGFLTEVRSKLVNRESLGNLALKVGLKDLLNFSMKGRGQGASHNMYGNAMEALIGAVYLDKGYKFTFKWVIEKLFAQNIDIDNIISQESNFKSRLIEWSQREGKSIRFELQGMGSGQGGYYCDLYVNDEKVATAKGLNKKKAEQAVAQTWMQQISVGETA